MNVEQIYHELTRRKKSTTFFMGEVTKADRKLFTNDTEENRYDLERARGELKKSMTLIKEFLNQNL